MYGYYGYKEEEKFVPREKLDDKRNPVKFILLNIITLGIYSIFFYLPFSFDLDKIAFPHDNKKTMNFIFAYLLSLFTLSIVLTAWHGTVCKRISDELERREIDYNFGMKDFWIFHVLLTLVLIGPFIYAYKLITAMNLLCKSYNEEVESENALYKKRW